MCSWVPQSVDLFTNGVPLMNNKFLVLVFWYLKKKKGDWRWVYLKRSETVTRKTYYISRGCEFENIFIPTNIKPQFIEI